MTKLKENQNLSVVNQFEGFINTPPLWNSEQLFGLKQFKLQNPPPITSKDFAGKAFHKIFVLGKRMERFLEYILKNSSNNRLIAANLQIIQYKKTLGEIDFLIEELETKKILHLEQVYKFYLYDPSFSKELERWIGPNRKDSLLKKIEKLQNKQLPLLYQPETLTYLKELALSPTNIQQQVCFKANLFVPRQLQNDQFQHLNEKCVVGFYLNLKEFLQGDFKQHSFYVPAKILWPVFPKNNSVWFSFKEIIPQIQTVLKKNRSPLVWMKTSAENFQRFFVTWW